MRLNKLAKKIFAAGLAVSLMMANAGVSLADTATFDARGDSSDIANPPYAYEPHATAPSRNVHATGFASHFSQEMESGVATATVSQTAHEKRIANFLMAHYRNRKE